MHQFYSNGEEVGNDTTWYENGNLYNVSIRDSSLGFTKHLSYYPNGKLKSIIGLTEKGMMEGEYKEFHPNGNISFETTYTNHEAQDSATYYYKNGQKQYFYLIENGLKVKESAIEWTEEGLKKTNTNK